MANTYTCDPGGFDGYTNEFDTQAVGLHAAALLGATGGVDRSGVVGSDATTLNYVATSGLSATLKAGKCVVASSDPARGVHVLKVPTDQTFTHDTNDSNPRRDLIIAEVNDVGTTSSFKRIRILKGTPAASPVDPTVSGSLGNGAYIVLHRVLIPATPSTALGTITDLRPWATAAGGLVRGATRVWSMTKANDGDVSANTYGQASTVAVSSGEALPGIYQYTFVTQVLAKGTLGAGACAIRYRFITPNGTTVPFLRKIGYGESDFETYSGIYVHQPASAVSLTFTAEAATSPGNGTAQILTIKGADSIVPSSVVVTRIADF